MCPHNIVKFIADYDNSEEYSKTEEYLCDNIEEFTWNLIKALQKKFKNFYNEGSSDSCIVANINGKIFSCRLIYNNTECKYFWNVELEKDD